AYWALCTLSTADLLPSPPSHSFGGPASVGSTQPAAVAAGGAPRRTPAPRLTASTTSRPNIPRRHRITDLPPFMASVSSASPAKLEHAEAFVPVDGELLPPAIDEHVVRLRDPPSLRRGRHIRRRLLRAVGIRDVHRADAAADPGHEHDVVLAHVLPR